MRRGARLLAVAAVLLAVTAAPGAEPMFYFEWIARSGAATTRLTLFTDRTLVRKTKDGDRSQVDRRVLSEEEFAYYLAYFAEARRTAIGRLAFDSGLAGDFQVSSKVVFRPPGKAEWSFTFDSFSALSLEGSRIKTALEGLRDSFGHVLPSPADFAPEKIPPGTVLTRADGARFRVRRVDKDAKAVELEGIDEPYLLFLKIDDLRFTFKAP